MPPQPRPAQPTEPVKVEIVSAAQPGRDAGWWVTTFGPVIIAALALVVAIVALVDQHSAEQTTETAAARTYASEVSFIADPSGPSQFEIDNNATAQITSVLVQPAPHQSLQRLGTIQACTGIAFPLRSATNPVIYFRDANGLGWQLPINGIAEPSADPSQIIDLLPLSAVSILPSTAVKPKPLHGC